MPFLAKEKFPISTKDCLSWSFDDINYDLDDPIYIDGRNPDNYITARTAKSLVRKLAAGFSALGLHKGDCVCVHSFNNIQYPMVFLGLAAIGGVFVGTNPSYTPFELVHALRVSKTKYILTQPACMANLLKAVEELKLPKERIIIFNPDGEEAPEGFMQWKDLLNHGEQDWLRFDDLETSRNTPAGRFFSSGTTGLPKATDLTHYNLIAQHTLVYEANPRPWRAKRVLTLPMFHVAAAPSAFLSFIRAGAQGFVLPRFEPESWLKAHEQFEITEAAAVPPMIVTLINHPERKRYNLKSVRVCTSGAAPLDKIPQARMQALFSEGATLTQVWGMTETSCIATRFPYPHSDTTGSVGWPLPNLDTKLVDDDGKDISGPDVRGELCVRGPTVVRGYFENPEANARDWDSDGYFHTGDIAYVDGKTGLYYIVDRKKELIKVRAFQVAPPELEGVLLDHPDIADVAVIGVPDPANRDASELPRGYIVRKDQASSKPTEKEIHEYMGQRLAKFKMLHGGVVFVESIPKNASGKILKRMLRERAKKETNNSAKL